MDSSEFERTAFATADHATKSRSLPTVSLLMCEPAHFGVTYSINPWMDPASWARDDYPLPAVVARGARHGHRALGRRRGRARPRRPALLSHRYRALAAAGRRGDVRAVRLHGGGPRRAP